MRDRYDITNRRHWHVNVQNNDANFDITLDDPYCNADCDNYRSRDDRPDRLRHLCETNRWSSNERKIPYRWYWPCRIYLGYIPSMEHAPWRYQWDTELGRQYWMPGVHKDNDKKRTRIRDRYRWSKNMMNKQYDYQDL